MNPVLLLAALNILSVAACSTLKLSPEPQTSTSAEIYPFTNTPELDKPGIHLGGFSGLSFEGQDEKGRLVFMTHTDRGPNRDILILNGTRRVRPFVIPEFQPQWVRFMLNEKGEAEILSRIPLMGLRNKPLTGLPNYLGDRGDEYPVDDLDKALPLDPMGLDLEGIARDRDGSFWMGEEYRPSILHFDARGHLQSRWIPMGNSLTFGTPVLPERYMRRVQNRGFEGIADDGSFIYAFLQGTIPGDQGIVRILKVNRRGGAPVGEYLYRFDVTPKEWPTVDKIGDAVAIGPGRFLVIEQNSATDQRAFRRIFEVDLKTATDILKTQGRGPITEDTLCPSGQTSRICVEPAQKRMVVDLAEIGMRSLEKAEGLAVVDASTLAVINDNDFGVGENKAAKSNLVLIRLAQPVNVR